MKGLTLLITFIFMTLILSSVVAELFEEILKAEWTVYKNLNNKSYSEEEDEKRMKIYEENRRRIVENNIDYQNGESSFLMSLNSMADNIKSEITLKHGYLGVPVQKGIYFNDTRTTRTYLDWRNSGRVTYVKDQGVCGCCYSIAAVGAIEGQLPKALSQIFSLSFQSIIDCSGTHGNKGCDGGLMTNTYRYLMSAGGIVPNYYYPYTGIQGECLAMDQHFVIKVTGWYDIARGNDKALQCALEQFGPIAVAIDATRLNMIYYKSGIYYDPMCSSSSVNHAVLLVGFGEDKSGKYKTTSAHDNLTEPWKYWIIKNSWGTGWGENGYIRMRRYENQCGILNLCSIPDIDKHDSTSILLQNSLRRTAQSQQTLRSYNAPNKIRQLLSRNKDYIPT